MPPQFQSVRNIGKLQCDKCVIDNQISNNRNPVYHKTTFVFRSPISSTLRPKNATTPRSTQILHTNLTELDYRAVPIPVRRPSDPHRRAARRRQFTAREQVEILLDEGAFEECSSRTGPPGSAWRRRRCRGRGGDRLGHGERADHLVFSQKFIVFGSSLSETPAAPYSPATTSTSAFRPATTVKSFWYSLSLFLAMIV